eukprot:gene18405-20260_t
MCCCAFAGIGSAIDKKGKGESIASVHGDQVAKFSIAQHDAYAQPKIKMKLWILLLVCVALCHQGVLSANIPEDVTSEEENEPREDDRQMEDDENDDDAESDLAENPSDEDEEKLAKHRPMIHSIHDNWRMENASTRTYMARCGRDRLDKLRMNTASASSTNNRPSSTHSLVLAIKSRKSRGSH